MSRCSIANIKSSKKSPSLTSSRKSRQKAASQQLLLPAIHNSALTAPSAKANLVEGQGALTRPHLQ